MQVESSSVFPSSSFLANVGRTKHTRHPTCVGAARHRPGESKVRWMRMQPPRAAMASSDGFHQATRPYTLRQWGASLIWTSVGEPGQEGMSPVQSGPNSSWSRLLRDVAFGMAEPAACCGLWVRGIIPHTCGRTCEARHKHIHRPVWIWYPVCHRGWPGHVTQLALGYG